MNLSLQFLCLIVVLISHFTDATDKLKIGIKKRIDDCTIKSRKGDLVFVHYTGMLENGDVFDSSINKKPLTLTLGAGQVIKGWDQGLLNMCEGEKRKLYIPPDLAYGAAGIDGTIPPNSVLIFEVELMKIERKTEF